MKVSNDDSDLPNHAPKVMALNLADLVSMIGHGLAAYIGGASCIQSVVD